MTAPRMQTTARMKNGRLSVPAVQDLHLRRPDGLAELTQQRLIHLVQCLTLSVRNPEVLVVDNGPEFAGRTLDTWAYQRGVRLHFIRPGKPVENGSPRRRDFRRF